MKIIDRAGRSILKSIGLLALLSVFIVPGAAMAAKYRVALIHPGTPTDLSWSNAWIDGANNAMAGNPDIEVVSVDLVFDPASYLQQGAAFASQGFDMVLMAHGAMVDQGITLAQQFPNVQFCLAPHHPSEATLPPNQPKNLCWIDVAQHNANFFAGALAAMVTKSGHVASLNGFAFPALTRQPEGFHLGARCVNPDIRFSQQYINTWTDTGIAKAAAQAVFATDADVIMAPTDSAVFGIVQAAKEAMGQGRGQVWVIPSYYESQVLGPDVVLTSAIHGLTFASQTMIERGASGSIGESSFHDFDATNNPEIYAPIYDNIKKLLTAEQIARYNEIAEKVRSGEIVIPDETTGDFPIGGIDSGAAVDLAAIGCI